jgi:small acid-soluble spore protein H (minor)
MDVQRAQQIISANDKITVEFSGVPVWIDSVDSKEKTAKIHVQDNPSDARTVAVQELQEVH